MYIPSYLNDIPRVSSPRSQLVPKERFRADGRQLDLRWKSEIRDRFSPKKAFATVVVAEHDYDYDYVIL